MGLSAATAIVAALFVALYLTLLLWRRAENRRVQALIITLVLPPNADVERVSQLEETLAEAVEQAAAGALQGDQFRAGGCTFFLQGPSAERLYEAVLQPLKDFDPLPGSHLIKRYGAPGARQQRVELSNIS